MKRYRAILPLLLLAAGLAIGCAELDRMVHASTQPSGQAVQKGVESVVDVFWPGLGTVLGTGVGLLLSLYAAIRGKNYKQAIQTAAAAGELTVDTINAFHPAAKAVAIAASPAVDIAPETAAAAAPKAP